MFKLRNKLMQLPRIAWFLGRQSITHKLDRMSGRERREEAVLEAVKAHAPAGDPAAVLAAMDEFAESQRWLMNVGPKKGAILMDALQSRSANRVLEIGAYCGYSAVLIGQELKQADGCLVSVEKSGRCAQVARGIVAHAGLEPWVSIVKGTLKDCIEEFEQPFDGIFLDHWKDEYLPDLKRLEKANLISPGAVVVADNIEFFDVPEYLEYVRSSGNYQSSFHPSSVEYNDDIPDGVEVSVFRQVESATR